MSELDRALDAELDRFRPSAVPPFAGLRRRARRQRQARWGGSSVLALGMVAAVALLVPGQLGAADRVVDVAGGSATPTVTTGGEPLRVIEVGFEGRRGPPKLPIDYRPEMERCAEGATVTQLLPNSPLLQQSRLAAIGYAVTLPRQQVQRSQSIADCLDSASGLVIIDSRNTDKAPPQFSYRVSQAVRAEANDPSVDKAILGCIDVPGTDGTSIRKDSLPAFYFTTRVGQLEALSFTRCIGDLPNVQITQTSTTAPAPSAAASTCLTAGAEPASEYLGLPEAFTQYRDEAGPPVRVVGRDGTCLPRARRLLPGGIDVVLDRGIVVAAERDARPRR